MIKAFGLFAKTRDWAPSTKVHPRDLALDRNGIHLLIEAKMVRANSGHAVREAIGQLLEYEYLHYPAKSANKVALFSIPVGQLWIDLLAHHNICAVWLDEAAWQSHGDAVEWVTAG